MRGTGRGTSPSFQSNQLGFVQNGLEALYTMDVERRNIQAFSEPITSTQLRNNGGGTFEVYPETAPCKNGISLTGNGSTTEFFYTKEVSAVAATYTGSFFAVADDGKEPLVGNSSDPSVDFSVRDTNGNVGVAATVQFIGGNVYRVSFSATKSTDGTTYIGALIYPGQPSGRKWTFGGFQINEGSTALPYIPTTNKQALYDYSGNGRHAKRGSVGSAFICPVGEKHLSLPGSASDYARTPDSATLDITGDLDIRADLIMDDWTPSARAYIVSKWASGGVNGGYTLGVDTGGELRLVTGNGSTATGTNSTVATGATDGSRLQVRVTRDSSTGDVEFFTRTDGSLADSGWTQLGTTVSAATGGPTANTEVLRLGLLAGSSNPLSGIIYRAEVYDGIDGTLVADFNPNRDAHGDVNRFTSSTTGEVWTINQASASDTNDPTWIGEGISPDGADDYARYDGGIGVSGDVDLTFQTVSKEPNDGTFGFMVVIGTDATSQSFGITKHSSDEINGQIWSNDNRSGRDWGNEMRYVTHRYIAATSTSEIIENTEVLKTKFVGDLNIPANGPIRIAGFPGYSVWASGLQTMHIAYSRALSDAEIAQNYRAVKNLLAQRGVSI